MPEKICLVGPPFCLCTRFLQKETKRDLSILKQYRKLQHLSWFRWCHDCGKNRPTCPPLVLLQKKLVLPSHFFGTSLVTICGCGACVTHVLSRLLILPSLDQKKSLWDWCDIYVELFIRVFLKRESLCDIYDELIVDFLLKRRACVMWHTCWTYYWFSPEEELLVWQISNWLLIFTGWGGSERTRLSPGHSSA